MSTQKELEALRAHFLRLKAEAELGLAKCDVLAPPTPAAAPVEYVYMTIEEYAKRRRVSGGTIRKWIRLGLPHRRVGKVIRILVAAADDWQPANRVGRLLAVVGGSGSH